jgi:hypothetical protein
MEKATKKRRTVPEMEQLIGQWASEGGSRLGFCRREGIPVLGGPFAPPCFPCGGMVLWGVLRRVRT